MPELWIRLGIAALIDLMLVNQLIEAVRYKRIWLFRWIFDLHSPRAFWFAVVFDIGLSFVVTALAVYP
jgi:hypothetical protein